MDFYETMLAAQAVIIVLEVIILYRISRIFGYSIRKGASAGTSKKK